MFHSKRIGNKVFAVLFDLLMSIVGLMEDIELKIFGRAVLIDIFLGLNRK
jgi:hypothetical protein